MILFCSFITLVKHYHVTYVHDKNKLLNINCQYCNGYVSLVRKSGKILSIKFVHEGMSNMGLYPEGLPQNLFFPLPVRYKMQ